MLGRPLNINYLALVSSLIIFIVLCLQQPIVQDDAYISFRYADNYLAGHGLVYNTGERVEGYTNFFWIITLILLKSVLEILLGYSADSGCGRGPIDYPDFILLRTTPPQKSFHAYFHERRSPSAF